MANEINVMKLRKGDQVTLRCGGTLKIRKRHNYSHDCVSYFLDDESSQPVTWFYDGRWGYSGDGHLDIVCITRKVVRGRKK